MRVLTDRLELVPASARLISADLEGRSVLAAMLEVSVPADWPPRYFADRREVSRDRLGNDPGLQGWLQWYWLLLSDPDDSLVGIGGFGGKPDIDGAVEFRFAVAGEHRSTRIATEAVVGLVDWVLSPGRARRVVAETDTGNPASIHVLQKAGFRPVGAGMRKGTVLFELRRSP